MENENIIASIPNDTGAKTTTKSFSKDELKAFYTKGVPKIVKTLFLEPISGTYALFTERSDKTYFSALVLMVSTAVLYTIIPYMLMGDAREYIGFSGALKLGIAIVVFMIIISLVAFGIKSVSGKPVFKNELLTGGLCGIPLTLLLLLVVGVTLFMDDSGSMLSIAIEPASLLNSGLFFIVIALYIFLMLINILQQSFKAGGTKDALAWYLSPVGVLLSFYLTYKIAVAFF